MLRDKIFNGFLFVSLLFILSDCRNNKTITLYAAYDSSKIISWKKTYDSLYDQYSTSRNPRLLEQSGIFADSILLYEHQLSKDAVRQELFFDVLFNRALDLNDLHYYVKSREQLDKYIVMYPSYAHAKKEMIAYAQKTLANIYSRYGDYKKAVLLLEQCLRYYTDEKNYEEIASCAINLSIPLKELKRYDEAEKTLNRIFDLPEVPDKKKATASIELADIYVNQRKLPEAGLQIIQAGQQLHNVPQGPGKTETYSQLYNIEGKLYLLKNDPVTALKILQRSTDSARVASGQNPRNREQGKTFIAMGNAMEQLHSIDSALYYYNKALYTVINIDTLNKFAFPLQSDLYAENTIAEALYAKANCICSGSIENIDALENAANCYSLAFETERKLLNAFSYDESRFWLTAQTRQQTEKAIALCYYLYQKTNDSKWANQAFLFAENNKAFVLAESIKRNIAASLFLQNDSAYQRSLLLRSNLSLLEIEMGQQNFIDQKDTVLIQSLARAKKSTEDQLLTAENNTRVNNPRYNEMITGKDSLPVEEIIKKTVLPGTDLVEYFCGDSVDYVFNTGKNNSPGFFKLPGAAKRITADFLHFFSDRNRILNDPKGYASVANDLYKNILAPYIAKENNSILLIPDGYLSYIPFDALLTNGTNSANISSFPFLIKQKETRYAFSCKTLLMYDGNENNKEGKSIAAFAPLFTNKERGIMPLQHSNEELQAIKELYPEGNFYSGAQATLKQFEKNCANSELIHIATHAYADSSTSPAGIEFYDSTLYLNRIYTLPLKAKLVVLSGCQTGTGAINKTEGLMSLARGFSYAGTKNVIASLWQTEDNSSASIFKSFYSGLKSDDFSTALHKAKLAAISNGSVASASPYYWSGYIYIGSAKEKIKPGNNSLPLILLICFIALIAGYLIFAKLKTT